MIIADTRPTTYTVSEYRQRRITGLQSIRLLRMMARSGLTGLSARHCIKARQVDLAANRRDYYSARNMARTAS